MFEFRITSRPKNSAVLRTPGIFERCGCQESAQTPFSEETQTPSSVLMQSEWLPSVWPGVQTSATPLPSSTSPSTRTTLSVDQVLDPVLHVPGPLHRVQRGEGVPLLALGDQLRVREQRRARLPARRAIGSVVPSTKRTSWTWRWSKLTKSTSSGRRPGLGERLVGVVPDRRQDLVGEELAELARSAAA